MADEPISALPAAGALAGTEPVVLVQGGVTVQATAQDIANLAPAGGSYYPTNATGLQYITYPAGPTAAGATITAGSPSNTKGSYVELVASSPFTCNGVIIEFTNQAASTGSIFQVDIATGAAGSETVVIPNLSLIGLSGGASGPCYSAFFPLAIAAGARIAARCLNGSSASVTCALAVTLIAAGGAPGCASFDFLGRATIDPGGSANTKGAYAQIIASTSNVGQYAVVVLDSRANLALSTAVWAIDLATGGAGSETVLVPDMRVETYAGNAGSTITGPAFSFPTYIPALTRVAARASCSITDATDRQIAISVYTATAP